MNEILLYPIALPIIAAVLCLLLPKPATSCRKQISLITTVTTLVFAGYIFLQPPLSFSIPWLAFGAQTVIPFELLVTPFARLVIVAGSGFALLIALYSYKYMSKHPHEREYFAYLLATLGFLIGAVLANNLIVLLLFWELLGLMLYLLVLVSGNDAVQSATKTLVIAVAGDLCFMLGVIFIWLGAGTLSIDELTAHPIVLQTPLAIAAYLLIMVGAFAKAGAMPMHSWIPAIATHAPIPTMAYLPASLDKLLGIYLLARLSLDWFVMIPAMGLILMIFGAITILGAVLMALIQHDFRKMLAFHAVSQVGYMVLGIGTGTPVGVMGGLFHMLNHAIYKCCLFLCGGSVQHQTGRTKFEELGGLARAMPWTFVTCLIAALAISGVPPMNGFVSKWMVYQGIIDSGGALFPIFLVVAMFGSALTLASFMKLLYSMFWGDRPKELEHVTEASAWMIVPLVVLASFAVGFGIFYQFPVENLIRPILGTTAAIPGLWDSGLATILLLLSLGVGAIIYLVGRPRGVQETEVFLGGEMIDLERYRVPGTQFYGPIKELNGLRQLYGMAERGAFDLYGYIVNSLKWLGQVVYKYIEQALADLYQGFIPALLSLVGQVLRLVNKHLVLTLILWICYVASIALTLTSPYDEAMLAGIRIVASIGMIVWAMLALVESDLMRLLLLGATSQMGFVVLGATLSREIAMTYLITGGVALVVLFASANALVHSAKTGALDAMTGLAARRPIAFYIFLFAAFWLAGLPPFGNFFSKFLLGTAAEEVSPLFSIAITGTAMLTLGYLLRPIRRFLMVTGKDAARTATAH